ncbi:MAG: prepilin peptidase [Candidatus Brocadiae bacterium]|nr:prepilin peptidase [Candidatus Brocadiia bacterium]
MAGGVPDAFWIVSAAALGATIGSFLNVCIYRMPRRCMTVAHPRHSRCPHCGHGIRWYENIPVLSWLALRGRCSGCRAPISAMYPLVEAITAAAFAVCARIAVETPATWLDGVLGPWSGSEPAGWIRLAWFGIAAAFVSAMIVSTVVDFEFQIIPDQITLSGAALAPLLSLAFPWLHRPVLRLHPHTAVPSVLPAGWEPVEGLLASLVGAAVGAAGIWIVGVLGKAVFRKDAMGLGDVKLMAFVGGLLGWKAALFVFLIACCVGSVAGVSQLVGARLLALVRRDGSKPDHYLAFGPYLALGALAMFFTYARIETFVFVEYPRLLERLAVSLHG